MYLYMLYTTLSHQEKVLTMSFDKIFEAYKEAILSSVNKRDFDKADILNISMNLLSNSINSKPVSQPSTKQQDDNTHQGSAVSSFETEEFIYNLVSLKDRVHASEALEYFYNKYSNRFTAYDYELNQKGEPRWKNRFWNTTSNMRKAKILMPNEGQFVNFYVLNTQRLIANN
jgi:hypothetical protein